MHIAVCDDNIADRKQLERLINREADKRKSGSNSFYADYFGNSEALCQIPLQYDLFFIDMVTESVPISDYKSDLIGGLSLALHLVACGVTSPIVLCSSKINYEEQMQSLPSCPSNLWHMCKPIKTSELTEVIDRALILYEQKVPTIELRSDAETIYAMEDDIIYATTTGTYITIYLKDGREISMQTDMINFYDQIAMFTHIVLLTDRTLFNITYLQKYSAFKVILTTGVTLKSSPVSVKRIKAALQDLA